MLARNAWLFFCAAMWHSLGCGFLMARVVCALSPQYHQHHRLQCTVMFVQENETSRHFSFNNSSTCQTWVEVKIHSFLVLHNALAENRLYQQRGLLPGAFGTCNTLLCFWFSLALQYPSRCTSEVPPSPIKKEIMRTFRWRTRLPVPEFKQIYGQKELRDSGAELLFIANKEPEKWSKSCRLTPLPVNLFTSCSSTWSYIPDVTGP